MVRLISRQRGGLAALKLTNLFGIDDFPAAKDSGKVLIIIIYCYLIIGISIIIISIIIISSSIIITGSALTYLCSMFLTLGEVSCRLTRSFQLLHIHVPLCKSKFGQRTFF